MSENTLTPRQREVLAAINRLAREKKRWPTVREIGAALGIASPNGVMCHLRALERKGVIEPRKESRSHGGVRVIGACPCCGRES